jgi:hypothetical protein
MSEFITRKELADMLSVSVMTIRRREVFLGLNLARVDINSRVIRYDRAKCLEAVRKHFKKRNK